MHGKSRGIGWKPNRTLKSNRILVDHTTSILVLLSTVRPVLQTTYLLVDRSCIPPLQHTNDRMLDSIRPLYWPSSDGRVPGVNRKYKLIAGFIVVMVAVSFAMSYWVRPHDPKVDIVSAQQELPDPRKEYPIDSGLEKRISTSYGLALVLVISEYSQRNAFALESLRAWALQHFQKDPGFLHNVHVDTSPNKHVSIIESLCYNLFAVPSTAVQEVALNFVRDQIADFHTTKAYLRFRSDYFDSFGLDRESAALLARYESDRARLAVDVLISSAFWVLAFVFGAALALRTKAGVRSIRSQKILSYFWILMGFYYMCSAWSQNQVVLLVSAWICGWIGIYLLRPVVLRLDGDKGVSLSILSPSRSLMAVAYWITFTLIAIQVLTWVRTGTLISPDPLSLLISSFSGNFLYDPTSAKRTVAHVAGLAWIAVSLFVIHRITVAVPTAEVELELASFKEISQ